ncbi:hypothetical protein QVA66_02030 [Staphylococcus chromogenes]|nr:hypothetical protein [Staphylococcus chromogenes]
MMNLIVPAAPGQMLIDAHAVAAQTAERPNYWLVYLLFIVAGLLVGGAYSAYQAGAKKMTYALAVLSAVALAAGLLWMIGEMT